MLSQEQFSKAEALIDAQMPNMRVLTPEEMDGVLREREASSAGLPPPEAGTSLEALQAKYGRQAAAPAPGPTEDGFTVLVVPKVTRGPLKHEPRTVIIAGEQIVGMQG